MLVAGVEKKAFATPFLMFTQGCDVGLDLMR